MKSAACFALLLALAGAAAADPTPVQGDAHERQVADERARIGAERVKVEAAFATAQKACYQKFAVSGCLENARDLRRTALSDLRRQEIALNDAQRRARAAEQMRALEARQAGQERKAREADAQGPGRQADREQRAAEKAAKAQQAGKSAQDRARVPREREGGAQAPDVAGNRERHEQRAEDAAAHKAQVQRRAAWARKDIKPLPVPQ